VQLNNERDEVHCSVHIFLMVKWFIHGDPYGTASGRNEAIYFFVMAIGYDPVDPIKR